MVQVCFGHVLGMSWACVRHVSGMCLASFNHDLKCFWHVLGMFHACFGLVPGSGVSSLPFKSPRYRRPRQHEDLRFFPSQVIVCDCASIAKHKYPIGIDTINMRMLPKARTKLQRPPRLGLVVTSIRPIRSSVPFHRPVTNHLTV